MVETRESKPSIVNGTFVVPKENNSQRLIKEARNANVVFHTPLEPKLPNPEIFAALFLIKGKELYVAKYDLYNYFHRLRLDGWLSEYFGLPKVIVYGKTKWAVVRSPLWGVRTMY